MSKPLSMTRSLSAAVLLAGSTLVVGALGTSDAYAQNRDVRNTTRTSVNNNANINRNINNNSNTNINRNTNVNTNVNRNTNVNVNSYNHVSVDVHDNNPFATAVAVTAGVAITAAAIGSMTQTLPPACVPVQVGAVLYQQCGASWYQPQYVGTSVQYVVVTAPRY
jgi:Flp pilus assembly protein TadG